MKNINLIRYIAWSFHKSTGIDFNELFSEACLAYCEALNSFDPEKGKLNNYATTIIRNKLNDFVKKERENNWWKLPNTLLRVNGIAFPFPSDYLEIKEDEFLDLLPHYARNFAEMVLYNLEDVPDELSPIQARIKIKEIFIQMGYNKKDVEYFIKQFRMTLKKI